jgi:glycosyltransferase involved in cell wall biosynthesis
VIAVLVPTYKRSSRLKDFIQNFKDNSSQATLYFIITPDDKETKECLDELGYSHYFVVEGEYVAAINYGFKNTEEPFVLCAADDIEFTKDWDMRLLSEMKDPRINVAGGIDDWLISQSGVHISHPLIRRSYIKDDLYHPGYKHYMCDIEFVQRSWKDNCIKIIHETLLHHRHPEVKTAEEDETYLHSRVNLDADWQIYMSRVDDFEFWNTDALFEGVAVPSNVSQEAKQPLISIILPVYNARKYVEITLKSIFKNTYHDFELIIIDDASDEYTNEFLLSLKVDENYTKCKRLLKIRNTTQQWVNHNWNMGVDYAEGDYIAVLNSDIVLSENWDRYLAAGLYNATVTCPWEHTKNRPELYKLDPIIEKFCPNMIKGACFMFKKQDADKLFPIPAELKHWCGDNWVADRAEELEGVKFVKLATIYHYMTRSGKEVDKRVYFKTVAKDLVNYQKLSGRDMSSFISRFTIS